MDRVVLVTIRRKSGSFEEIGVAAGVALNEDGQEQAGMGVAIADYDEDGYFDIVKTDFSDDTPNVYQNNGDGTFTDPVYRSGLGARTQYLGWGIQLMDIDHDGRKDIVVINGHVYPEVDKANLPAKYRQPRLLYWNVGDGKFVDLSEESGPAIREAWSSRGSAAGDLDNDGSLEVVISNLGARPSLLKNYGPRKGGKYAVSRSFRDLIVSQPTLNVAATELGARKSQGLAARFLPALE